MARPGSKRNSTFFWQGLLILLPVALLAAFGFFFARQDKLIAEHEAVQRAENIAQELLPKLQAELVGTNVSPKSGQTAFEVDANGRLLTPPPAFATPVPVALDLSSLNLEQRPLWLAAGAAESLSQDTAPAIRAYREFLAAHPPPSFAALAQYSLGLLLAKSGDQAAARSCFQLIWEKYPEAAGESGLPLRPLAGLKLIELHATSNSSTNRTETELVSALCSNAVWKPTPLSAEILDRIAAQSANAGSRATAEKWKRTWLDHELARALFAAASEARGLDLRPESTSAPSFWFLPAEVLPPSAVPPDSSLAARSSADRSRPQRSNASWPMVAAVPAADQSWLAFRASSSPTNAWFTCRSLTEIGTRLTGVVAEEQQIPEYFGVGLDVAGKHLTWPAPDLHQWEFQDYFGRIGGGQKKVYLSALATNVLASATLPGDPGLLKVSVYLTSRGALLAREQARSFWLAALVASAALAAGLGFVKAYRAFHRQLRLSEMKSNFVSSVSHELRAPIASVRLLAESLERGKVAESVKEREYYKFIVQECRRLSSLVENVLDFSRIEQGRKQYDFEPTDLGALVEQTVKLMEPYAAERQVTLELRPYDPEHKGSNLQLNADGKALQQALVNLIDNAVKHSPKGQMVSVGVERRTGAPPVSNSSAPLASNGDANQGSTILLWVEDQGEGIPPAEHDKIFERFYRRGSELRRETQGVGIGLSIVKHIVEAHHGHVQVRSDVGQGSRFTIELPENGETAQESEKT